ncbi:flavin reductase family protein [Cohnella xylanilytica]|uniref:Flavin reductase family protein n=1 Tax=Cohnella xylanilytica TaxID=557555 RepID=A0A841U286_9BACL|nr:flavin reductase family protein [Cohnella xylanilytica]MBB6694655.1 flavin reductase family protein [Cohnella xylanilytica]
MAVIDPSNQSESDNYKLLIGSILPRPIALVTTLSEEGVVNAAPFSYFNIVCSNPPMISVAVQRKNGVPKDTSRNAMSAGSFVVHIADESNVGAANEAAAPLPPDESELPAAGLTQVPSEKIPVPGVAEAKVRMECVLERSLPLGGTEGTPQCDLLIGRVVCFHVADELLHNGRIDALKLRPVSRLAGNNYAKLGEIFTLDRPE